MSVTTSIWDKLTRVILYLIVLACVLAIGRWYLPVIQKNRRLREDLLQLNREVQREEETTRQLRGLIDALQHDPKTVERRIREKLGYVKPDETVVFFVDSDAGMTNATTDRPRP